MRTAIKHIVARTYKPLLEKYLSRVRRYRHGSIQLEVPPQVFHPGFFSSTHLLLGQLKQMQLAGKNFFEPGCGSGLISIYAAKKGANVTASDINPVAINYLAKNGAKNRVHLSIVKSNLFEDIPEQRFDIIAINPPYYKKEPHTEIEYAWFCGSDGEYFTSLFEGLGNYTHDTTEIRMVLCDGCDIKHIQYQATHKGFLMECVQRKKTLLEENYIFRITKAT